MCKLVAEAAELKSDETKLTTSQARRQLKKPSKGKDPACRVSFEFRFFIMVMKSAKTMILCKMNCV